MIHVYDAHDDHDVCPRCGELLATGCDCTSEQVQYVIDRSNELSNDDEETQ